MKKSKSRAEQVVIQDKIKDIKKQIKQSSGITIAFNTSFMRITNNLHAGILLSQLVYWAEKMDLEEFYKSNHELQKECCLSRSQLDKAKIRLQKINVIRITKKSMPCKIFL